jgi:hypothetical protein
VSQSSSRETAPEGRTRKNDGWQDAKVSGGFGNALDTTFEGDARQVLWFNVPLGAPNSCDISEG